MPEQKRTDRFVRNAKSGSRTKTFSLLHAFGCAWEGIVYTFASQRNLKIQLCFAIAAVILGFIFGISPDQWCIIVVCIALVMALECVNTAIESTIDLVSPEWHELAKHAKDCAAGAVYVCALGSLVVAALIFIPRFIALFA